MILKSKLNKLQFWSKFGLVIMLFYLSIIIVIVGLLLTFYALVGPVNAMGEAGFLVAIPLYLLHLPFIFVFKYLPPMTESMGYIVTVLIGSIGYFVLGSIMGRIIQQIMTPKKKKV
ncbi:MAG TPA: hypothetical protein VJB66_04645 [Candidatus Nanoarchaeia archaeon]|nr:hypothetical protein [Candidatus Nanoarchaeia archaeon]